MKKRFKDINSILITSERRSFIILICLNTLLSIADIASIALVFLVLNIYTTKPAGWISTVLEKFNLHQQSLIPALLLVVIFITKSISGYFIIKAQSMYISDAATRLTSKNLLLYLEGSYADHVSIDSAVWIRRICFQPMEFAQYILSGLQQIINEFILIVISITALALYNIKLLAIVSLVLLPAIVILELF